MQKLKINEPEFSFFLKIGLLYCLNLDTIKS